MLEFSRAFMEILSGIYKVVNTVNSKIYVGSTLNFTIRWARHLNLKTTKCKRLKNAMIKHGVDKFSLVPIELIDITKLTRENADTLLKDREQFFLDTLKPFNKNGYNIHTKSNGTHGTPHTEQHKKNISGENSLFSKPVNQYDLTGTLIKSYINISQAAINNKPASVQTIIRCCKNTAISTGGFMWSYVGNSTPTPRVRYNGKKVALFDNDEIKIQFNSVKEAASYANCTSSHIVDICKGKTKNSSFGYWKYL